jgi:hypothetical protein
LNAREYLMSTTFAGLLNQPFFWVAVVFAIVATIYTVAQWNDIGWNGARASVAAQRYPMIYRKSMPESWWATTDGAATTEVSNGTLPIGSRKCIRQSEFFGDVALIDGNQFRAIVASPLLTGLLYSFWMSLSPSSCIHLMLNRIALFVCTLSGALLLKIAIAPPMRVRTTPFAMFLHPEFVVLLHLIWVTRCSIAFYQARLTRATKPWGIASSILIEILRRGWKFIAAYGTALDKLFVHGAILCWPCLRRCGQAARLAFQTVHEAVLSHGGNYTPCGSLAQ